jgi:hypothetical protein
MNRSIAESRLSPTKGSIAIVWPVVLGLLLCDWNMARK